MPATRSGETLRPARHSWINVESRCTLPAAALEELLRDSYRLVAEKLPKKIRAALGLLESPRT